MPSQYPLSPEHPLSYYQYSARSPSRPKDNRSRLFRIIDTATTLLSRATDLYLSAVSINGELRFILLSDENVYSEELTSEWMDEVKAAAEWYLGDIMSDRVTSKL